MRTRILAAVCLAALPPTFAQSAPKPPKSVRLYVFDCGVIKGLSPAAFNFKQEEVKATEMVVPCYLIVHPKGTMIWDTGTIADSAFKPDGSPVTQGTSVIMSATKPLKTQLAAVGYKPSDITYLGLSHYHSDHTANANDYAGATWLVHKEERDVMFAPPQPGAIISAASFSALKDAKTTIIKTDDYDVFGDKTVIIKFAPGHTPGHQVLFLNLKKSGPILIAGDLYHYPEERATGKTPTFEFNREQSLASRAKIEAFLKQSKAQMWIEHDEATFVTLKKAPAFYD
jgi:glyoxylase-like metal-dependent hydrolase (beta-lactamase superfamily II)